MNRERLEDMVDFLSGPRLTAVMAQHGPESRFDLGPFVVHRDCGTVACAIGWRDLEGNGIPQTRYCWEDDYSFSKIAEYYGIGFDRAVKFFVAEYYSEADSLNPLAVAKRIQEYLDTHDDNDSNE